RLTPGNDRLPIRNVCTGCRCFSRRLRRVKSLGDFAVPLRSHFRLLSHEFVQGIAGLEPGQFIRRPVVVAFRMRSEPIGLDLQKRWLAALPYKANGSARFLE